MANFIATATKNKGGLHRSLGVPEGQKIPPTMIRAAASSPGKVGRQARLAETLTGLRPKKKRKVQRTGTVRGIHKLRPIHRHPGVPLSPFPGKNYPVGSGPKWV